MRRLGTFLLCCSCLAAGPSASELAKSIRAAGLDPGECYRVRDLRFQKEDVKVYFTEGYLLFSKPVEGHRRAALFTAEVEGGDGEVILLPPYRGERQSLAMFTNSANLDEHFRAGLLIFTDGAEPLLDRMHKAEGVKKADDLGPALVDRWNSVLENVRNGTEMRMLIDILGPQKPGGGMLFMAFQGRETGNFDVIYDPRSRDQIEAGQMVERNGKPVYNVWTSFTAQSVRKNPSAQIGPAFTASDYRIEAALDSDLGMKAVTRLKVKVGDRPMRGFPFEISGAMHVTSAKIDGVAADVFSEPSVSAHGYRMNDNNVFLVTAPDALESGSEHEFEVAHEGSVIVRAGNNVFYVGSRASWYPRYGETFAKYDLTFRYPKRWTLVSGGDQVSDATEGETRLSRWRTPAPIRMAGFNLGDYEKVVGNAPGFNVVVYGNKSVELALMPRTRTPDLVAPFPPPPRSVLNNTRVDPQPQPVPDPRARLREVAADVASSLEFMSSKFGPPPLKTLTVSPIPGTFGQGFPGLVYLSTLSYLDPSQRPASMRGEDHQVFFSDMIVAHEVAHQWWGNVVTVGAYQDEWMTEALANYSALVWLERKKGIKAADAVLDSYRDHLLTKTEDGRTVESAGPMIWGTRLDSTGVPGAWRVITYEKGAWIFHMLRRRMGDERFFQMLAEMRKRFEFRTITTEDIRSLAKEFAAPKTSAESIDAFFDNWVFSTGIPSFKLKYSVRPGAAGAKVTGSVTQNGVDDDFTTDVPVELQFAKAPPHIIWVRASNDGGSFSVNVKQAPARVVIGSGVLTRK